MLFIFYSTEYTEAEGGWVSSTEVSATCSRSGSPTPRNSPKVLLTDEDSLPLSTTSTLRSPLDPREILEHSLTPSARSTLTKPQIAHVLNTLKRQDTFSR